MEQIDVSDKEWLGEEITPASREDAEDREATRKACSFCYYSHYDCETREWTCWLEDHKAHPYSNHNCPEFTTMADRIIDVWCGQVEDREVADRVEAREGDELDKIRNRSSWDEYDEANQAALADSG